MNKRARDLRIELLGEIAPPEGTRGRRQPHELIQMWRRWHYEVTR